MRLLYTHTHLKYSVYRGYQSDYSQIIIRFYCQLSQLAAAHGFLLGVRGEIRHPHHPVVSCDAKASWEQSKNIFFHQENPTVLVVVVM